MRGGQDNSLIELNTFIVRLKTDFKQLRFREGERFAFRPPRTIIFEPTVNYRKMQDKYKLSMLHELGHAILEHKNYTTGPERLRMESEAWEKARELCSHYHILYDNEYAEGELDTYREWLHRKSCCPQCGLTRYQTRDGIYHCPLCDEL